MPEEKSLQTLSTAVEDKHARGLFLPAEVYRPAAWYGPDSEPGQESVLLGRHLWILKRHWWKILIFVAASMVATAIVCSRLTPVFEATAMVDVDRQTPAGIVGQEAVRSAVNDSDQFLATQVKLIQSDSVLRPVAEQYHLRELEKDEVVPPPARSDAREAPVLLSRLKVTRPPNTYLLLISYRSTDPRLAANVANAVAKSYLEHTYNIRIRSSASLSAFMERQLEELKAKMERSSAALVQFEKELNVINPEEKTSILSARLQQLNNEYTNAQADRVRKEAAHQSVGSGTLEAAQVSSQGETLKKLTERLDETEQKFAEISVHFGANHPEYRRAAAQVAEVRRQLQKARQNTAQRVAVEYGEAVNREQMLKSAVAATKAEFDRLNARSFEYQALKREAEADKKLYEELVRKIKEAGINAGFQNSSIRIADLARPPIKPVFPNLKLNLILAFLLSTLFAVGTALAADLLNTTVRDPEQVSRSLNAEVVGTLPLVRDIGSRALAAAKPGAHPAPNGRKRADQPLSSFDEAVRTLRNSILLADFDRRIRSLMVTSAAPSEGKSTVAVHLAMAHAQQGRKTLLIDGDLRRPSVHRCLNMSSPAGLSTVLNGGTGWRDAVVPTPNVPNLDVLLAGPPSRRAADLIGSGLLSLIEEASREYDLVLLDSPPLLGFAEPLQMATAVDGVLVIALAGQTNRRALGSALSTLSRLRVNIAGVVLNSMKADTSQGYYYYHYHHKYYRPGESETGAAVETGDHTSVSNRL